MSEKSHRSIDLMKHIIDKQAQDMKQFQLDQARLRRRRKSHQ